MSDASDIPEHVRLAAEQAGLGRALKLFPESVKATFERGARPLGAPPKGAPPLIHPAPVFDPTRFERSR
jgi:hypothetical protein